MWEPESQWKLCCKYLWLTVELVTPVGKVLKFHLVLTRPYTAVHRHFGYDWVQKTWQCLYFCKLTTDFFSHIYIRKWQSKSTSHNVIFLQLFIPNCQVPKWKKAPENLNWPTYPHKQTIINIWVKRHMTCKTVLKWHEWWNREILTLKCKLKC